MFACNSTSPHSDLNPTAKFSPFFCWKWYVILFEMAFCLEIFSIVTYWAFLNHESWENTKFKNKPFTTRFCLVTDNSLPFLCMVIEYFTTQPVIAMRHILILFFIITFYLIINLSYSIAYRAPYAWTDWHTVGGVFIHIAIYLIVLILYIILVFVNIKKLGIHGGNDDMLAVLRAQTSRDSILINATTVKDGLIAEEDEKTPEDKNDD